MAAMTRLRMLDFVTRAPLDCPVAVVFGHANAMNWAAASYDRVGLEIASSLCAAGYPADLFPSSLVERSALRLDDEGYVCLGPQRYRALVLYRPEYCGQPELEFFGRAVLGKTAIFQVGEWTCDSEARPLKTAQGLGEKVRRCPDDERCATAVKLWLGDASVQRVTGWDRKNLTHPLPPVDGLASLTDGTCIRAKGSNNAAGDPILETFTWQGHAVEVDALGLVAIRFAPDGRVTGFAAGGLKRVKTDGLDLELPERADLAFLRNADGTGAGVLQGLAGDVPAPLQAITRHWQRLAVPRQAALSPTSPHESE